MDTPISNSIMIETNRDLLGNSEMGKELSELTLEELWELFPIFLVEHNEKWTDDYKEIEALLQQILSGQYH